MAGAQIVVQRPVPGIEAFGLGVVDVSLLGGEGTEQVMEGVAAGDVLGQQVRRR